MCSSGLGLNKCWFFSPAPVFLTTSASPLNRHPEERMNEKYMVLVLEGIAGWTSDHAAGAPRPWGWGETLERGSCLWPVSFLV